MTASSSLGTSASATEASHTVPGAVLLSLIELVAHWAVSPEELLAPFSLTHAALVQPQTRFPRELYIALTERARSLTAEPALLDEDRRERALLLLRAGDLSVTEIGDRLGYQNTQNFERAFRRWTGTTPAAYRRS
jgi:AraC-like DNA-binding protein